MMIVQQLYDGKYLYTFKTEISELSGPRLKQQKHLGRKPLGVNPAMTRTLATMIGTWYFVASFPTYLSTGKSYDRKQVRIILIRQKISTILKLVEF